jgi:hypothetical protein
MRSRWYAEYGQEKQQEQMEEQDQEEGRRKTNEEREG